MAKKLFLNPKQKKIWRSTKNRSIFFFILCKYVTAHLSYWDVKKNCVTSKKKSYCMSFWHYYQRCFFLMPSETSLCRKEVNFTNQCVLVLMHIMAPKDTLLFHQHFYKNFTIELQYNHCCFFSRDLWNNLFSVNAEPFSSTSPLEFLGTLWQSLFLKLSLLFLPFLVYLNWYIPCFCQIGSSPPCPARGHFTWYPVIS